jgi:eukaryotic-like serine/threonine-protein kinase
MTPERFRKIEELYHAAREGTPEERAALLAQADPELRREVELLLSRPSGGEFLDRPALQNAPELLEDSTVTHLAGQSVSHYRILEMLGAGGMGVVYKAFDTKLDRHVALKFLPTHLRGNEELKRRLKEEARAASTLDHPNIVVIHDIGETQDGDVFIAMAFHEGATLRDRIRAAPGGLPVAEALQIARQIATGLAKAHDRGILHRDIKPGNVIVATDGVTRIIDFGLAKSGDATLTGDGSAKGTPQYMSPEQASGKPVDVRTDLWSLGAVLYEMVSGRAPFRGENHLQVMRAVVEGQPPALRESRPGLSPEIEGIVARALRKDPAKRYQSAGEMARDLSVALAGIDAPGSQATAARAANASRRRWIYGAALLVTLLACAGLAWRFGAPRTPVTSASEFIQLTNFTDWATAPALSPDGRMVTFLRGGAYFLGDGQVYVKMLPDGESRQLTNDPNVKYGPVFTPDGSRVAYTELFRVAHRSFETWTVPILGGPPAPLMANAAGLGWIGPDRVLFSGIMPGTLRHMGILTAKESRAEERAIYFPAHQRAMAHYSWLSPDRSSVLIVEMDDTQAWQRCRVVPMDGKSAGTQVGPEGACGAAAWSPDGRWVYLNVELGGSSHLWRQRWRNRAPDGKPEQITFGPTEEEGLAAAPDGKSLIASIGVRRSSVWTHDVSGDRLVSQEGSASAPALSADGKRLYYLLQKNNQSDVKDLWQRDLVSNKSNPVLPGMRIVDYEISRDETQVALTAVGKEGQREIFVAASDRSAPPRLVVQGGDSVSFGAGGQLIFRQLSAKTDYLAHIQADGSGLERIQDLPILAKSGASPDGEWVLAGGAGTTHGMFGVSVKGKVRRQICTTRCDGKWSPDGKYFYLTVGQPARSNGRTTYILPIPRGAGLPDLPLIDESGPSGMRSIPQMSVAPGPDPGTYAFATAEFQGNLFRIPLH